MSGQPKKQKKGIPEKHVATVQLPENQKLANKIAGADKMHYELLQKTYGCEIKRREYTLNVFSVDGVKDETNRNKTALALTMFIDQVNKKPKTTGYKNLVDIINTIEQDPSLLEQYTPANSDQLISNKKAEANMTNANTNPSGPEKKGTFILKGIEGRPIHAQNQNQELVIAAIEQNDMVVTHGPAGGGKTYAGVAMAVKALKERQVKRIILTRPVVEAVENLGFMPGNIKEKLDPFMQPIYDSLGDMMSGEELEKAMKDSIIQIVPFAFMRGRTLNNAFVILDEAQNTTEKQMDMFLSRMGKTSRYFINGDLGQIDLPNKVPSGLRMAKDALKDTPGIAILQTTDEGNLRHSLVPVTMRKLQQFRENRELENQKRLAENPVAANENNFAQNHHDVTGELATAAVAAPTNGNGHSKPKQS